MANIPRRHPLLVRLSLLLFLAVFTVFASFIGMTDATSTTIRIDGHAGMHGRGYQASHGVEVLAKTTGIVQLDVPRNSLTEDHKSVTLSVSSWPHASLEGLQWTPKDSDQTKDWSRHKDIVISFDEGAEQMNLQLTGEPLREWQEGGRLVMIDYFR